MPDEERVAEQRERVASIDSQVSTGESPHWTIARAAGYSLLIAGAFLALQTALAIGIFAVELAGDPELNVEEWTERLESNGGLLALATIGTTLICVPFIVFLAGLREADPWAFLGFRAIDARSIARWSFALIACVAVSDSITIAIGRSVVPEFMIGAYSSVNPALLFAALVFAAPLSEEIFFCGFVLGALESSGLSLVFAAVMSSLAWAAMHTQYDLYGIVTIFLLGLLLAAARAKTGSLLPCLVMHGLANAIAFSEAAFVAGAAAV